MRDWYALSQLTLLPLGSTVALHLLLLAFLVVRWQSDSQPRTIEARLLQPAIINATLVDAASLKPKKPPPAPVRKTPPRETVKAAVKPVEKPAAKPVPKPAKAAPAPVEKALAAKPEPAPKPRISPEELAANNRRELADAVQAEQSVQAEVTAEQMSASYAALIRNTVTNYWSRPASARNGMEVVLSIQLVPTGEIVSVSVVRSSGSTAFDRSAINAVEKAGSFPELRNLPSREFEDSFRRFQLLFRPEDLRY